MSPRVAVDIAMPASLDRAFARAAMRLELAAGCSLWRRAFLRVKLWRLR